MSSFEKKYKKILLQCLGEGEDCNNRTGVNAFKLFNKSFNINLNKGFPIVTGKKIFFDKALAEFRWMFEGRTDISYLNKRNVKWWNDVHFRSSDLFLGLPYDIIVGALFLTTMAEQTNLLPNYLGINLIDAHIYKPHIKQTLQYCKNKIYKLPVLQGKYESYSLLNYNCNNYIKAELIK